MNPWGWGAFRVETPPADWVCPDCGKNPNARKRKRESFTGRHIYSSGEQRCTPCAQSWYAAHLDGTGDALSDS
jgi:hypothetical protein